jgi:hypothetical protein
MSQKTINCLVLLAFGISSAIAIKIISMIFNAIEKVIFQ